MAQLIQLPAEPPTWVDPHKVQTVRLIVNEDGHPQGIAVHFDHHAVPLYAPLAGPDPDAAEVDPTARRPLPEVAAEVAAAISEARQSKWAPTSGRGRAPSPPATV